MKKTFLTTTAIIAAFAATDAKAGDLQVNVGGYADFQAGYTSDDIIGENDENKTEFNTDAEIHFSVEGSSDNGLEYGAVVELEAGVDSFDNSSDSYDSGTQADKAYLFVQGGWGRVEMGENTGAEEALAVNTGNFASATGGVEGDFYRYIGTAAGSGAVVNVDDGTATVNSGAFAGIVKPKLVLAHSGTGSLSGEAADEDATKITYYSPRFAGFQIGASYIPNTGDTARFGSGGTGGTGDNEDTFTGGINYTTQYEDFGLAASLTGLTGSDKNGTADLEGYAAGANLTFAGFTLGGSYGDYQDTLGSDAEYFDVGLGYTTGAFSASVTYLDSSVDGVTTVLNDGADDAAGGGDDDITVTGSDFENIVIGVDYQLAPGLVPYAEVALFEQDTGGATGNNEGTVVMLGTQLSF